jgi:sugar porter (SP) family MFS transporter
MANSHAKVRTMESSLWRNRKCLAVCTIVAIANLQYGYDTSAIGALQAMPGFLRVFGHPDKKSKNGYAIDVSHAPTLDPLFNGHNANILLTQPTFQQLISSLMTLGAFVSCLTAGTFSRYFGRKPALYVACVLSIISVVIQMLTTNKSLLYFGRLLIGMANGFFATFSTIYLAEAAPVHQRGVFTALFKFWIQLGNILGTLTVNYTSKRYNKSSYQIPLGCLLIIPTILLFATSFFVPESPRYLLLRRKDQEARKAFDFLRAGSVDSEFVELEWVEMIRGRDEETQQETNTSSWELFKGTNLRRTLLCYGTIASQTGAGIWFVIAYQTYFFTIIGASKPFEYSLMNTCIGFAGCIIGMIAMRHFLGRRAQLGWGAFASGVCQLVPAIVWTVKPDSSAAVETIVAFFALYYFCYGSTLGVATYSVASEVPSTRLRATTLGTATSLGQLLAWLSSFCTPYFINPARLHWVS